MADSPTLQSIKEKRDNMLVEGFYAKSLDDYIRQAEIYLNSSNTAEYNKSIENAEMIIDNAYESKEKVEFLKARVEELNLHNITSETANKYVSDAENEFLLENYAGACELADKAIGILSLELNKEFIYLKIGIEQIKERESVLGIKKGFGSSYDGRFMDILGSLSIDEMQDLEKKLREYNQTINRINDLNATIMRMKEENLATERFNDLLASAIDALAKLDNRGLITVLDDFEKQRKKMAESITLIDELKKKLDDMHVSSYNAASLSVKLKSAENELHLQNYEKALELSYRVLQDYEELVSQKAISASLDNNPQSKEFFKKYYPHLSLVAAVLISMIIFFYKPIKLSMTKTRIRIYKKRAYVFHTLLADAQRKYFKERSISRESYKVLTDKYQEKIVQIRERLSLLEKKA